MPMICDVCESAPAMLFCAADEAALCRPCDEKVHMCNKLASRHVRVGLAQPNKVPRCDICENAPAFFYCEFPGDKPGQIDDSSMQPVAEPNESHQDLDQNQNQNQNQNSNPTNQVASMLEKESMMNHNTVNTTTATDGEGNGIDGEHPNIDAKMIDLNMRPARTPGQTSNTQTQGADLMSGSNQDSAGVVPTFQADGNS